MRWYEYFRVKRRGELIHRILRYIVWREDFNDIDTYIKRAFVAERESFSGWDIDKDFRLPIISLRELPEFDVFFPSKASGVYVLSERSFFYNSARKSLILRPDRVILYDDRVVVVDFKATGFHGRVVDEHREQVEFYAVVLRESFERPVSAYLLFLEEPVAVEVKVCNDG